MWHEELLSIPNFLAAGFFLSLFAVSSLFLLSYATPWVGRKRKEFVGSQPIYRSSPKQNFHNLLNEDPSVGRRYTPSEVYLSVVIPAMNEKERLPVMLTDCFGYLNERKSKESKFTYEVIIVDDGSNDGTADLGVQWRANYPGIIKVLKLEKNYGKGGAVRMGTLHSRGQMILFADADGATTFEDYEKLEKEMKLCGGGEPFDESFPIVVVGSRAHLEAQSRVERSVFRTILMHGFHSLVYLFAVKTISDTQCGFKLFSRSSAARIFPVLHIERWAFDVELLYLCEKWKIPVQEVSVRWREIDGSKITPVISWLQMGRDLLLIWFRYTVGLWTDRQPE
ncbi:unnamed protein product [Caenorhabditis auriculariae]|uniref:dolichyl-phosphate beta-glucosyltransferase n=1 Tax=Caenorhabditis auriculariae TaxID=2777116 RepID=A0A8S1HDT5_9PELO|nr:unnamed protein product [Caenorhabditis auriculariae]